MYHYYTAAIHQHDICIVTKLHGLIWVQLRVHVPLTCHGRQNKHNFLYRTCWLHIHIEYVRAPPSSLVPVLLAPQEETIHANNVKQKENTHNIMSILSHRFTKCTVTASTITCLERDILERMMYCRLGSSVCCLIDPSILHISRTVRYDMMIDSCGGW